MNNDMFIFHFKNYLLVIIILNNESKYHFLINLRQDIYIS